MKVSVNFMLLRNTRLILKTEEVIYLFKEALELFLTEKCAKAKNCHCFRIVTVSGQRQIGTVFQC